MVSSRRIMEADIRMAQIMGDFKAKENVLSNIDCAHLGIQSEYPNEVVINEVPFQLSYLGFLELYNIKIDTLYFNNDTKNTIIEYI